MLETGSETFTLIVSVDLGKEPKTKDFLKTVDMLG